MKKAISISLAVLICFMGFALPLAQPASAVAGTIVVGAVLAVLAMSGITFAATMTSQQLQTYVSGKLDDWAGSLGEPLDHLINSAGIGMTISGMLTIGTAAAQGINDFITWLRQDLSLVDNSQVVVSAGTTSLNGYPMILSPFYTPTDSNGTRCGVKTADCLCYWFYDSSNARDYLVAIYNGSSIPGRCIFDGNGYDSPVNWQIYNGRQFAATQFNRDFWNVNLNYVYPVSPQEILADGMNVTQSGGVIVDTGTITITPVGTDDKYFLDVGALPGDTVGQITIKVITDAAEGDLVVDGTVAEAEPEYVIDGPVAVSGLDSIFPFCIPFDIYHFLEALAAEPEAPVVNWRFYVPGVVDETIELDFSQFDTVAQVLRTIELLAFIVGLAFVTRKLIRG